jgi:hypothetical protein
MSAVPVKCLHCKQDLRYDPANLRYRCPRCDAGEAPTASEAAVSAAGAAGAEIAASEAIDAPGDAWRERGEAVGREAARLLHRLERWLSK